MLTVYSSVLVALIGALAVATWAKAITETQALAAGVSLILLFVLVVVYGSVTVECPNPKCRRRVPRGSLRDRQSLQATLMRRIDPGVVLPPWEHGCKHCLKPYAKD